MSGIPWSTTFERSCALFIMCLYRNAVRRKCIFVSKSGAIRTNGRLLVSFVEDMRPMEAVFNGQARPGRSTDGRCSIERHINIRQVKGVLYEYHEASTLTRDGKPITYEDTFRLREWLSDRRYLEAAEGWLGLGRPPGGERGAGGHHPSAPGPPGRAKAAAHGLREGWEVEGVREHRQGHCQACPGSILRPISPSHMHSGVRRTGTVTSRSTPW